MAKSFDKDSFSSDRLLQLRGNLDRMQQHYTKRSVEVDRLLAKARLEDPQHSQIPILTKESVLLHDFLEYLKFV